MGLSKSTRIMILLAIDTAFFFVELIAGYTVHSLALVADSFHMVRIFRLASSAHADKRHS
jgi:zinc transporter 1